MFTAITFMMALEAGVYTDYTLNHWTHDLIPTELQDEQLTYILYEGRASYRFLFAEWGFNSTQYFQENNQQFMPVLIRYDVGFGLSHGPFTVGFRHWCEHPVAPFTDIEFPLDQAKQSVYFRLEKTW